MIQCGSRGGGQSALIDSPPYSSNSSVVGSEDHNNGTSSGCPSMADAAEFYVSASMPASPASSTSSLDQLLMSNASSGHNGEKREETGSTLASLLVSNISPLLSSMDAANQPPKSFNHSSLPQRGSQAFSPQPFGAGNSANSLHRTNFVTNLFQQNRHVINKWKKAVPPSNLHGMALLSNPSVNEQPQSYGKLLNCDQSKRVGKGTQEAVKVGQKRKSVGTVAGMGMSKSCPVSPAMKEVVMAVMGNKSDVMVQGSQSGMGSEFNGGPQGPKTKKCRRVYGLNQKNLWCTQCQWKKACARFKPPKLQ